MERICGVYPSPEYLAFLGRSKSLQPLYRVSFSLKDVWPMYTGKSDDTIDVEIYQHWLTKFDPNNSSQKIEPAKSDLHEEHGHTHDHGHVHEHNHDHDHDHVHEKRQIVEQNSVNAEGAESPFALLASALIRILNAKKIVTNEEITTEINLLDSLEENPTGSKLVARAWKDPVFKELLLKDFFEAAKQAAINYDGPPIVVLENSSEIHNIVVCTLCSCYPKRLLGRPPDWYKSRSYRARVVIDPRGVLKEFGVNLSENVKVRTHDSTADMRYLVIPVPPENCEKKSVEELEKLVSRDAMIGVAR